MIILSPDLFLNKIIKLNILIFHCFLVVLIVL